MTTNDESELPPLPRYVGQVVTYAGLKEYVSCLLPKQRAAIGVVLADEHERERKAHDAAEFALCDERDRLRSELANEQAKLVLELSPRDSLIEKQSAAIAELRLVSAHLRSELAAATESAAKNWDLYDRMREALTRIAEGRVELSAVRAFARYYLNAALAAAPQTKEKDDDATRSNSDGDPVRGSAAGDVVVVAAPRPEQPAPKAPREQPYWERLWPQRKRKDVAEEPECCDDGTCDAGVEACLVAAGYNDPEPPAKERGEAGEGLITVREALELPPEATEEQVNAGLKELVTGLAARWRKWETEARSEQAMHDAARSTIASQARTIERLENELEQERVRLAGCGAGALGYADDCKQGDYGWSGSLGDVQQLRARCLAAEAQRDALQGELEAANLHAKILRELGDEYADLARKQSYRAEQVEDERDALQAKIALDAWKLTEAEAALSELRADLAVRQEGAEELDRMWSAAKAELAELRARVEAARAVAQNAGIGYTYIAGRVLVALSPSEPGKEAKP